MRKDVNIALMGFGTVGGGTMEVLKRNRAAVEARVGARLRVRWVCGKGVRRAPSMDRDTRLTEDWHRVVADPLVDCVVEMFGGTVPAKQLIIAAMAAGKHIVTSNKAVLSHHWDEIFDAARRHRKLVYFEAAVGGGVPVVQALNEGLAANRIGKIVGILNGTTNFILSQMKDNGLSFAAALKLARKAGFAEADPTFDVEGIDVAQKISILGSIAIGRWVPPEKVHCEGITRLEAIDLRLVDERLHSTVKLLGIAEEKPEGWVFRVHPTLVHNSHPFANVRNEFNAVSLHGDAVGEVMLYGKGAGRFPTGSAVASDIMFLCRQIATGVAGELPYVGQPRPGRARIAPIDVVRCRYYIRVSTLDRPGVLSQVTGILGRCGVSLASVHQDIFEEPGVRDGVPVILLTHESREAQVRAAIKAIDRLPSITAKAIVLRME